MSTLKKLKNLRRQIKMIPKKNIDLDAYVTREATKKSFRDAIMCPAGWAATNTWNGKGLSLTSEGEGSFEIHKGDLYGFEALAEHFGLEYTDAQSLFGRRKVSEWGGSDKKVFLERLNNIIANY